MYVLQTNAVAAACRLPFTPLHRLCNSLLQLVHLIELLPAPFTCHTPTRISAKLFNSAKAFTSSHYFSLNSDSIIFNLNIQYGLFWSYSTRYPILITEINVIISSDIKNLNKNV